MYKDITKSALRVNYIFIVVTVIIIIWDPELGGNYYQRLGIKGITQLIYNV